MVGACGRRRWSFAEPSPRGRRGGGLAASRGRAGRQGRAIAGRTGRQQGKKVCTALSCWRAGRDCALFRVRGLLRCGRLISFLALLPLVTFSDEQTIPSALSPFSSLSLPPLASIAPLPLVPRCLCRAATQMARCCVRGACVMMCASSSPRPVRQAEARRVWTPVWAGSSVRQDHLSCSAGGHRRGPWSGLATWTSPRSAPCHLPLPRSWRPAKGTTASSKTHQEEEDKEPGGGRGQGAAAAAVGNSKKEMKESRHQSIPTSALV